MMIAVPRRRLRWVAFSFLLGPLLLVLFYCHIVQARGIWDGSVLEAIPIDDSRYALGPGRRNGMAFDKEGRLYFLYRRRISTYYDELNMAIRDTNGQWTVDIPVPTEFDPSFNGWNVHAGILINPVNSTPEILFVFGGLEFPSLRYIEHGVFNRESGTWDIDSIASTESTYWHEGRNFYMDMDSLGGLHGAWTEYLWDSTFQGYVNVVVYMENTSGVWCRQVLEPTSAWAAVMRVEADGRAHIAYEIGSPLPKMLLMSNRFRGDTVWTTDTVPTGIELVWASDMAIGDDGAIHLVGSLLDCFGCLGYHTIYTRRDPATGAWSPLEQLYYPGAGPNVELDCNGIPHILVHYEHDEVIFSQAGYIGPFRHGWRWEPMHLSYLGDSGHEWAETPMFQIDGANRGHAVFLYRQFRAWDSLFYFHVGELRMDATDMNHLIADIYFEDPVCDPVPYDFDCSGVLDTPDLVLMIDYLFHNGPGRCQ